MWGVFHLRYAVLCCSKPASDFVQVMFEQIAFRGQVINAPHCSVLEAAIASRIGPVIAAVSTSSSGGMGVGNGSGVPLAWPEPDSCSILALCCLARCEDDTGAKLAGPSSPPRWERSCPWSFGSGGRLSLGFFADEDGIILCTRVSPT